MSHILVYSQSLTLRMQIYTSFKFVVAVHECVQKILYLYVNIVRIARMVFYTDTVSVTIFIKHGNESGAQCETNNVSSIIYLCWVKSKYRIK